MEIGTEKRLGFDGENHEHRERLDAIADCPGCGKEVECWAETDCWTKDGEWWNHSSYGGSMGVCEGCNILIADCLSDGFKAFDLNRDVGIE